MGRVRRAGDRHGQGPGRNHHREARQRPGELYPAPSPRADTVAAGAIRTRALSARDRAAAREAAGVRTPAGMNRCRLRCSAGGSAMCDATAPPDEGVEAPTEQGTAAGPFRRLPHPGAADRHAGPAEGVDAFHQAADPRRSPGGPGTAVGPVPCGRLLRGRIGECSGPAAKGLFAAGPERAVAGALVGRCSPWDGSCRYVARGCRPWRADRVGARWGVHDVRTEGAAGVPGPAGAWAGRDLAGPGGQPVRVRRWAAGAGVSARRVSGPVMRMERWSRRRATEGSRPRSRTRLVRSRW